MKRIRMVLIDWVDTGVVHGWQNQDEIVNGIAHCQSLGFLTAENEESITIVFGISDQGLIMERKTIPRGCIKSVKELRVK